MAVALGEKKLFLLDMDGTIYLDDDLFPGTVPFLEAVRARGGRYLFLTNNSSRSRGDYVSKLRRLGVAAEEGDFLTSVDALIAHLEGRAPYRLCYAFGTASFRGQLAEAGVPVTDRLEDEVDCLLIGFDTELTFQKLEDACILLNRGVDFIATNPDWVCPTWYGSVPDCGSVCEMLFRATGRRPWSSASPSRPWPGWPWSAPAFPRRRPWWWGTGCTPTWPAASTPGWTRPSSSPGRAPWRTWSGAM